MSKQLTTNQMVKLFASVIGGNGCEKCDGITHNPENEYGEFICDDCAQNAAETAYERQCEDFHSGCGPLPLIEQQRQALKFK